MYLKLRQNLDKHNVKLVAVSKTKPIEAITILYDQGQRTFGENRVQELVDKYESLPKDIEWHFIGHLQKNKVKYIAPFVSLIHSVDSLALATVINKHAIRNARTIDILIQVKVAREESKYGYSQDQLQEDFPALIQLSHVRLRGIMGMGTFTPDQDITRQEFQEIKSFYDKYKDITNSSAFDLLSMGMSGDYQIAIEEGSNMVRIGSLLFGARS